MTVLQILVAVILLLGIPMIVGSLFGRGVDQDMRGPVFWWISGQIFLWACFQLICVPLILEKIYKNQILPMISKGPVRWTLAVPFLDSLIYAKIRRRLIEVFGGDSAWTSAAR